MKKMLLIGTLITTWAQSHVIEEVVTQKGYVLSIDLHSKKCANIWTKQIKEFKKNNPQVKDPNVLAINQLLMVQNCQAIPEAAEKEVAAATEVEHVIEIQVTEKKEKSKDLFVIVGKQFSKVGSKGGDSAKSGDGVKFELGKYFTLSEDRLLKASLGYLSTKTRQELKYFGEVENKANYLTADVAYLMRHSKLKFGPNIEVLYSPLGVNFNDAENKEKRSVGVFGGLNAGYDFSERVSVDLKVQNSLESRLNIMTSIGLELRF